MRNYLCVLVLTCASFAWSAAAAQAHDERVLVRTTGLRLRMGGDVGFGSGFASDPRGSGAMAIAVTVHVRAGAQIDDDWAVHYQAGLETGAPFELGFAWGSVSSGAGFGAPTQAMHTSSILGELTLANVFQVAMGPTFGIGEVVRRPDIGDSLFVGGGFSARVGMALGGNGVGTRQGLSIATQLDLLFAPDGRMLAIVSQTFGWDTF